MVFFISFGDCENIQSLITSYYKKLQVASILKLSRQSTHTQHVFVYFRETYFQQKLAAVKVYIFMFPVIICADWSIKQCFLQASVRLL